MTARGNGHPPRATTPAECRACKGDWGPHGLAGEVGCLCATPDGGKRCKTPLDCAATCLVDDADASKYTRVRCGPSGCANGLPFPHAVCSRVYIDFGCHAWLLQFDSPTDGTYVEVQPGACLD